MRYARKVDKNQSDIVEALRDVPGVTVVPGHDDILVGYKGKTYWYEVKNPSTVGRNGRPRESALKKSQKNLIKDFTGHYKIVWTIEQILSDIGITS